MKNFVSVSTNVARYQDISLNPQKLTGQCAKLKCCLNYEADTYIEAVKKLPSREIQLETKDSTYYYFKADALANQITYSTDKRLAANLVTITAERAFAVIQQNKNGEKPDRLDIAGNSEPTRPIDLVEQESLTRFDKNKKRKNKKKRTEGKKSANAAMQSTSNVPQENNGRHPNNDRPQKRGGNRGNNRRRDNNTGNEAPHA